MFHFDFNHFYDYYLLTSVMGFMLKFNYSSNVLVSFFEIPFCHVLLTRCTECSYQSLSFRGHFSPFFKGPRSLGQVTAVLLQRPGCHEHGGGRLPALRPRLSLIHVTGTEPGGLDTASETLRAPFRWRTEEPSRVRCDVRPQSKQNVWGRLSQSGTLAFR